MGETFNFPEKKEMMNAKPATLFQMLSAREQFHQNKANKRSHYLNEQANQFLPTAFSYLLRNLQVQIMTGQPFWGKKIRWKTVLSKLKLHINIAWVNMLNLEKRRYLNVFFHFEMKIAFKNI